MVLWVASALHCRVLTLSSELTGASGVMGKIQSSALMHTTHKSPCGESSIPDTGAPSYPSIGVPGLLALVGSPTNRKMS